MSDAGGTRSLRCNDKTLEALRRTGDPLVFDPDLVADIRTEMRVALDDFARAARAGLRPVRHQAPDRLGARLRGAPPRARRVRVEAGHGEGSGGAPGDPADAVVARRALPHRSRRRGDGPAGRRGPRHRHLDGGARAGRRGRPAGDVDRAGHEVRRELPAARPPVEPGDRGGRAVAVGRVRSCCGRGST